jgi:hypothetical protein
MKGVVGMIVTSKRVFLNILTQMMDAPTLINANYYLADQESANGAMTMIDNSMRYDDSGQLIIEDSVKGTLNAFEKKFNIYYGDGFLNPVSFMSRVLTDVTGISVEEKFFEHLTQPDTLLHTYKFLYGYPAKGNGLRIMIYRNEQSLELVSMICDYISQLFGEDVTFLDPMYRKEMANVKSQYPGNREKSKQTYQFLKKYSIYVNLRDTVWNIENGLGGFENLSSVLNAYDLEDLFMAYEIMYPTNPLPPGNYSKDHLMHIIMSTARSKIDPRPLHNLAITDIFEGISDEELMSLRNYGSKD